MWCVSEPKRNMPQLLECSGLILNADARATNTKKGLPACGHTTTHSLKQGTRASQTHPRTHTHPMQLEAAPPNVSKGAAQTKRYTTQHPRLCCRHTRRRAGMYVVSQLCHSGPPQSPGPAHHSAALMYRRNQCCVQKATSVHYCCSQTAAAHRPDKHPCVPSSGN